MVLLGPGRGIADALHAGRYPVLLLVEALGDVFSVHAAVLGGPIQRFLRIEGAADAGDIVHRAINLAGRVGHLRDFHHRLHAWRITAPGDRRAQREDDAVGCVCRRLGAILIHPQTLPRNWTSTPTVLQAFSTEMLEAAVLPR